MARSARSADRGSEDSVKPRVDVTHVAGDEERASHPLDDPLGSNHAPEGGRRPRASASRLGDGKNDGWLSNGSLQQSVSSDVPISYRSGTLLRPAATRSGYGQASTLRPGYFDLQRLAQQADLWQSAGNDAAQSVASEDPSMSGQRRPAHGLDAVPGDHMTSSSEDDLGDEQNERDVTIPTWLKDSTSFIPPGRPASRTVKANTVFDVGMSISRSQSRATRPPSRTGAFSPNNTLAARNPRKSILAASPGPYSQGALPYSHPGGLPDETHTSADLFDEAGSDDEAHMKNAEEKYLSLLASLHGWSDAEIAHFFSTTSTALDLRDLHSQKRPGLSVLHGQSTSTRASSYDSRRTSEGTLSTAHQAPSQAASTNSAQYHLIRNMSKALTQARDEAHLYKDALEVEKAKAAAHQLALTKRQEAREDALRQILASVGVSMARADRALKHAQAQADVPVFKADERVTEQLRRARSPLSQRTMKGSSPRGKREPLTEDLLPASLMEAMQEELRDSDQASASHPTVASAAHEAKSADAIESPSTNDGVIKPSRDENPVTLASAVSPARKGDEKTISPSVSPGAKAGGLMPWANSIASRKSAPVVQTSAVETEHDIHETPTRNDSSRPSSRSRAGSRASIATQSMRSLSSEARALPVDIFGETDGQASEASSAAVKTGGFDFFATIGWRRRRKDAQLSKAMDSGTTAAINASTNFSGQRLADSKNKGHSHNEERDAEHRQTPNDSSSLARKDTIRARNVNKRPEPQSTLSGRDVTQALHEAIGSAPLSPGSVRPPATRDLPKPPHFKAIFLATRIMTPDPSSVVLRGAVPTTTRIQEAALMLVRRAQEEGKHINDDMSKTGQVGAKGRSRSSTTTASSAQQSVRNVDARLSRPAPITPASGTYASAATLSKTLSRYAKSAGLPLEPNVTRLPGLFGLAPSSGGYGQDVKRPEDDAATNAAAPADPIQRRPSTSTHVGGSPVVTELEPILAHDVRPPTVALLARQAKAQSLLLLQRQSRPVARSMRKDDALGRGVESGEESSGDEFEVYGGKHLDLKQIDSLATSIHRSRAEPTGESALLTDQYGFVYDATPAEVRLLRRAREEYSHAPASLTGIRVCAGARGGSDDEEEAAEEKDSLDSDADDDDAEQENAPLSNGTDDIPHIIEEGPWSCTSVSSAAKGKPAKGLRLLEVRPAPPLTGTVDLSPATQTDAQIGPTSPSQERLHFLAPSDDGLVSKDETPKKPQKKLPSTSQTVRRLLSQLQDMHERQQAKQQVAWDGFLDKRKEHLREKQEKPPSSKLDAGNSSSMMTTSTGGASLVDAVRKGGGALGFPTGPDLTTITSLDGRKSATYQDHWTLGELVDIRSMKSDGNEFASFRSLIQGGIPLVYRAKVWYECSGAGLLTEPGRYEELLQEHENVENTCTKQIDLDVGRTMPTNVYFSGDGPGVPKLRRLLVAYSWYNTKCGYCQGMNNLAATLLLTHATEEEAFWVLASLIERILPEDYYTSHLLAAQADQRVLLDYIDDLLPNLATHVRDLGVDLPAVTFAWFLSLYTDCLPVETLLRLWDVLFVEGDIILFRIAVAIFRCHENQLLEAATASTFYSIMHSMTSRLFCADEILRVACEELQLTVRMETVRERRTKHVAALCNELGLDVAATSSAATIAESGSQTPSTSSLRAPTIGT